MSGHGTAHALIEFGGDEPRRDARPVAMACQTSASVPGTWNSTSTERRPDGSFLTLMMAPGCALCAAEGERRTPRRKMWIKGYRRHGVPRRNVLGGGVLKRRAAQ